MDRDKFRRMTKRGDLDKVLEGIFAAKSHGLHPIKLNAVIERGVNDDDILPLVEFSREHGFGMRFIEYMPFKDNTWTAENVFGYAQMRAQIESKYRLVPLPTEASAVAKDFAIEGYKATASFITSMTDSFCGTCNRLRLCKLGSRLS